MEDLTSPSANAIPEPASSRSPGLAQTIAEQRRQIEVFLATHRDHMNEVEAQVAESLGRIIDELICERAEAAGNQRDVENREAQLEQESQRIAQMRADLDAARADWEQTRRAAEEQQASFLQQLRDELGQRPRSDGGDGPQGNGPEDTSAEIGEYKQRYEMSIEDIRQLREENKAIKEELDEVQARATHTPDISQALPLSWEAQKLQILASLDGDFDEKDQDDVKKRAQIEDVMQATDRTIAQKVEEIKELKQLLKSQSDNIGAVAVGAAAFGEILDNDQIIAEERESLKQLQEELQGKLRTAEIDISLERAKIARERAELDEKLRILAQKRSGENASEAGETADQEKPTRGRWLSRLGLNDLDK